MKKKRTIVKCYCKIIIHYSYFYLHFLVLVLHSKYIYCKFNYSLRIPMPMVGGDVICTLCAVVMMGSWDGDFSWDGDYYY